MYTAIYTSMDCGTSPDLGAGLMIYNLVISAFIIVSIVAMWEVYSKAGRPGWAAIVPFYSEYVLFDVVYGNGLKFLLLLVPLYNIYLGIKVKLDLAKAFGKSAGFGVGLIFLSPVFLSMLAFGDAQYVSQQ